MTSKEALENWYNTQSPRTKAYEYEHHYRLIKKDLEILEILKEFLKDADTGTGWIEININPEHDILDSEEHKEKQKKIKEWLNEER